MKINDKHLAAYGTSPEGIDKEGYLSKRGEVNKVFQRRWFVLKGNLLFYGEKRGDKPNGVIVLENCSVEASDADRYSFTISFFGEKTRVYVLSADSDEDMICWIKLISKAPFGYAVMVVKELEKRLARLKRNEDELLEKQRKDPAMLAIENEKKGCPTFPSTDTFPDINTSQDLADKVSNTPIAPERNKHKFIKSNANRNTINGAGPAISFNNLLTVGKTGGSTRNTAPSHVIRSRSSENLYKLTTKASITSPVAQRRKFAPSIRRRKPHIDTIEHNIDTSALQTDSTVPLATASNSKEDLLKPPAKSFFYILHNQYAASIWTAVKEYETGSSEDLLAFE